MPKIPNITLLTAFPTGPITPKLHKNSKIQSANTAIRRISFAIALSSCRIPFVFCAFFPCALLPEPLFVLEEAVFFFFVPDLLPEAAAILISSKICLSTDRTEVSIPRKEALVILLFHGSAQQRGKLFSALRRHFVQPGDRLPDPSHLIDQARVHRFLPYQDGPEILSKHAGLHHHFFHPAS